MKVSKFQNIPWGLIALLVAIGVAGRLLPHLPNVTAVGALAIWAGMRLPFKQGVLIVLGTMLITDLFLGFYAGAWVTYVALLASLAIAHAMKNDRWHTIGGATLIGGILFFLITNNTFIHAHSLYPHTWSGMMASYAAAVPFLKLSLIGDLAYVAIFFTLEHVAAQLVTKNPKTTPAHIK